jgi:hypothetical protein
MSGNWKQKMMFGKKCLFVSRCGWLTGLDGLVLFVGRLHAGQVGPKVVLADQPLVLLQPGFAHARLLVESGGQLLQLLLPGEGNRTSSDLELAEISGQQRPDQLG